MIMKKIAIIILTWNGLELTKKCIESLLASRLPDATRIVVVDNGSVDGTQEYLKTINNLILIENGYNMGYSKAVNIGIKSLKDSDYDIVLLNNDVEIIQEDWLIKLQEHCYSDNDIGIGGVKILKSDLNVIQHCGAYMPIETYWGQQIAGNENDINQYDGLYDVESVVFACAYIKRSVILEIGVLWEDLFAYFEDTDYCLRAKKCGFRVVLCGDVKVRHAENSSAKINKVNFNELFLESQATFKDRWSETLEIERYDYSLDWHSIINFPSGYAGTSRSIILALDKVGIKPAYKYVYGAGTPFPVDEPEVSDSYMINCIKARNFGASPIQVVYAQADVFEKNNGLIKIGYSMLEVSGIPREWVRQANLMDEVWVPSEFNKITFRASGVRVPIHVVPLGIDPAYYSPRIHTKRISEDYTFLSIFEWGERKSPEILLRAFSDEFSSDEPVSLICKVNNMDGGVNINGEIINLRLRRGGGKIVIAENFILKAYDMAPLYCAADCFVLPTRGEGWGMPILEAMACGLPVIATNWSAQTEFMNPQNSYPIDVESLIPAKAKCPYYDGFKWASPSYEHLRYLMRWVYENRSEAADKGAIAAKQVRDIWTWSNTAAIMKKRFDALLVPNGVRRFWGADPRLGSLVGARTELEIVTTGKSGYLTFGPYCKLYSGDYKAIIYGFIGVQGAVDAYVEIAAKKGEIVFAEGTFLMNKTMDYICAVNFKLDCPCTDLEVRIWVGKTSDLIVSRIDIEEL